MLKSRLLQGLLLLVAWAECQTALALGTEEFGNAPVSAANYADWPGIVRALNHTTRCYQSWVNGHERFVGLATAPQINELVALYLDAGLKQPEIVLLPGPGRAKTFQEQELPCDWEIEICGGISAHLTTVDSGRLVWPASPRLTIYVSDRIKSDDLRIPVDANVVDQQELKRRLRKAITDSKDQSVRGWGCGVLAAVDPWDVDSVKVLGERLADGDAWVRLNAAGALQSFGRMARGQEDALRQARESGDAALQKRIDATLEAIRTSPDTGEAQRTRQERQATIGAWLERRTKR